MPKRRVVVVEDHPIFRDGLIQCLDAEPDFRVVGQWATGAIDAQALARLAPDLVLMDVELPERSGMQDAPQRRDEDAHGGAIAWEPAAPGARFVIRLPYPRA